MPEPVSDHVDVAAGTPRRSPACLDVGLVARAGWACVLMLAPDRVLRIGGRPPAPDLAVAVARVLATRHLVQAVVTAVRPSRPVLGAGAVVDAIHASTDLGLAAASGRWRRIALIDAAVAAGLAVADGRRARLTDRQ
nr:hypothetical protein [uncultured Actinoplanes sp.]